MGARICRYFGLNDQKQYYKVEYLRIETVINLPLGN